VYIDEYGDFKPSVFGNVIRPALSDKQGWAVFGGTPKGKNQFWEIYETATRIPSEWFLLRLPATSSGILPATELAAARAQLAEDQYLQEYECSFEAAILGAFFGKEMREAQDQGRSIIEQLAAHLGVSKLVIVPELSVQDGIQAARQMLPRTWFDAERCSNGLEALRQYQREYDEDKKAFRERPRHDWTSHAADAFRMLAIAWRAEPAAAKPPEAKVLYVGPQNEVTLNDMWAVHDRNPRRQRI
jgi:hypothetical protein